MAAFDVPWTTSMSDPYESKEGTSGEAPTYAAFSPTSTITSFPAQRSTVVIHQKSPLLLATPPQVTRALAYSHPFLTPLNKLLGLLSWTTDDPWESFLLVAVFWAVTLYGDVVTRWLGPLLAAVGLVVGMYSRRFSSLSTSFTKPSSSSTTHSRTSSLEAASKSSHSRSPSSTSIQQNNPPTRHHKSLDSILQTLTTLTHRCNLLLAPFLALTDFLSTQMTATSSTTSPALTALFLRLLAITPIWFGLTLPPLYLITTRRVILTFGTIALTYHSRPAKVSRVILWRSRTVRRITSYITGLSFPGSLGPAAEALQKERDAATSARAAAQEHNTKLHRKASQKALNSIYTSKIKPGTPAIGAGAGSTSIQFTFALWENQRRWIGIGWTGSMLAYERHAWTDEELNAAPAKEDFRLPFVDGGVATWRWVEGSKWRVEISDKGDTRLLDEGEEGDTSGSVSDAKPDKETQKQREKDLENAWLYSDTKWRYPRRGQDGWGKYTRRRKWVREAELVDVDPDDPSYLEQQSQWEAMHGSWDSEPASVSVKNSEEKPPALPPRPRGGLQVGNKPNGGASANPTPSSTPSKLKPSDASSIASGSGTSTPMGSPPKRGWFCRRPRTESKASTVASSDVDEKEKENEREADNDDDGYIPLHLRGRQGAVEANWGVGEDVGLSLG